MSSPTCQKNILLRYFLNLNSVPARSGFRKIEAVRSQKQRDTHDLSVEHADGLNSEDRMGVLDDGEAADLPLLQVESSLRHLLWYCQS